MNKLEKWCVDLRHCEWLHGTEWLWRAVRPAYNVALSRFAARGLTRLVNGTDSISILPELRWIPEAYEPDVWKRIMSEVRSGDVIVDVGAYVGLYAIALAKRIGSNVGRVFAFEPDPKNFDLLRRQTALNDVKSVLECQQAAVGDEDGVTHFILGLASQSRMSGDTKGEPIRVSRLDSLFPASKVDIIKIDVEGYEEKVLRGAEALLSDERRKPRAIFIEVHPYNWHLCGTTSDSLLNWMTQHGYKVLDLENKSVFHIDFYGEIVAVRAG